MRTGAALLNEAANYYATGYSRAKPGNPVADLGQFLYELRDFPAIPVAGMIGLSPVNALGRYLRGDKFRDLGLPKPKKPLRKLKSLVDGRANPALARFQQLSYFKALGSEYLNVVFGWEPFVRDLQKLHRLWQTIDKRLADIIRQNGKGIRRKADVLNDRTQTVTGQHFALPYIHVGGNPGTFATGFTDWKVTTTVNTRVWFAGKFQYYIPDIGTSQWSQRATRALYGVKPTPELLWNVLPWSWLIDWFSNVGDCVSNLDSGWAENLICKYSFIMKHTSTETKAEAYVFHEPSPAGSTSNIWPQMSSTFTSVKLLDEKARVGGGNPFGLRVQLPSLSAKQLGILAALGISRGLVK